MRSRGVCQGSPRGTRTEGRTENRPADQNPKVPGRGPENRQPAPSRGTVTEHCGNCEGDFMKSALHGDPLTVGAASDRLGPALEPPPRAPPALPGAKSSRRACSRQSMGLGAPHVDDLSTPCSARANIVKQHEPKETKLPSAKPDSPCPARIYLIAICPFIP